MSTPARLPKAELHCHVEGTASPALARALAERGGVALPPVAKDGSWAWNGFSGFLDAYDRVAALFTTEDDYRRLASEYLSAIAADGAIHAEFFVSPDHAMRAGLDPERYIAGLSAGLAEAEAEHGIVARLIVTGVRHFGEGSVRVAARFAARMTTRYPVTGFGLAGDERLHGPSDFAPAFAIARDAGLGLTAHAGEFGGADSVRATIEALDVSRIGHGVRAIEDEAVVALLLERGTVLEVCPGSNIALGVVPNEAAHPLRRLHEAGVRVTVSSDDPPFFATSLAEEYAIAGRLGFTAPEQLALTRNAVEAAFVDERTRRRLLEKLVAVSISLGAVGAKA